MDINKRIEVFATLGEKLTAYCRDDNPDYTHLLAASKVGNPWFTKDNINLSIKNIVQLLDATQLNNWVKEYPAITSKKRVGIIMAGNIPLVGFTDFLAVVISGHKAMVKLSSSDTLLPKFIIQQLIEVDASINDFIEIVDGRFTDKIDAVIATGSNNSSRYFDYYFGNYPNIIRKNRTSVAVLGGAESKRELELLGKDVFSYFGLGCRNVSKLYLPVGFDTDRIFEALVTYGEIIHHSKYNNNYAYHRALWLMNQVKFLDNNFIALKEDNSLHSPVGSLFYEYYQDIEALNNELQEQDTSIQCVATNLKEVVFDRKVAIGATQSPSLKDYPDGVDVMQFLSEIQ